jgi:hypothetical protein
MTFLRSIAILAGTALCIAFAYGVGHALAMHSMVPAFIGIGLLLAGAAILAFINRSDRQKHPGRLERQGWV